MFVAFGDRTNPPDKITVPGILIAPKYSEMKSRATISEKLGLEADVMTVILSVVAFFEFAYWFASLASFA